MASFARITPVLAAALLGAGLACDGEPAAMERHLLEAEQARARGRLAQAEMHYREALRARPDDATPRLALAWLLEDQQRVNEAIALYREGLVLDPDAGDGHGRLGSLLLARGRVEEAAPHLQRGLELGASSAAIHAGLAVVAAGAGRLEEAVGHNRTALGLQPDLISAANNLAWILATAPDPELRDAGQALRFAQIAVQGSQAERSAFLDTLAASYAAAGRFAEAAQTAQRALALAEASDDPAAGGIRERLALYAGGRAYVEAARTGS